jgi:hypothetical protein
MLSILPIYIGFSRSRLRWVVMLKWLRKGILPRWDQLEAGQTSWCSHRKCPCFSLILWGVLQNKLYLRFCQALGWKKLLFILWDWSVFGYRIPGEKIHSQSPLPFSEWGKWLQSWGAVLDKGSPVQTIRSKWSWSWVRRVWMRRTRMKADAAGLLERQSPWDWRIVGVEK